MSLGATRVYFSEDIAPDIAELAGQSLNIVDNVTLIGFEPGGIDQADEWADAPSMLDIRKFREDAEMNEAYTNAANIGVRTARRGGEAKAAEELLPGYTGAAALVDGRIIGILSAAYQADRSGNDPTPSAVIVDLASGKGARLFGDL